MVQHRPADHGHLDRVLTGARIALNFEKVYQVEIKSDFFGKSCLFTLDIIGDGCLWCKILSLDYILKHMELLSLSSLISVTMWSSESWATSSWESWATGPTLPAWYFPVELALTLSLYTFCREYSNGPEV